MGQNSTFLLQLLCVSVRHGISAATALSKQIIKEGAPAVEPLPSFLKSGSSDYPIEVLKKAGVDMTKAEPIQEALKVFEEKLTELESLLA